MGNKAVIRENEVQRMSAGTGITHSEYNDGDEPVHFHQIWFLPEEQDLEPSYAQQAFDPEDWHNTIFPLASGQGTKDTVSFHSNATLYRCALDEVREVDYSMKDDRKIFIYVIEGNIIVNDIAASKNDQLRIDLETHLDIHAESDAEFILIDVASCKGFGYSEKTLHGS